MAHIPFQLGSTSFLLQIQPGVVLKYLRPISNKQFAARAAHCFTIERQIFEVLGTHPRIIQYLGWQNNPELPAGLLLAEANRGSLQEYINNNAIPFYLQKNWCRQVVESIAYIHHQGVIHCDLRPDNFLVHATLTSIDVTSIDVYLCDFGGSACRKLGIENRSLPDSGFHDPNSKEVSNATDIFSIASILYTILTGHWPYRQSGGLFESGREAEAYDQIVNEFFRKREFPDVNTLWAGNVIIKCWMNQYASADDVLRALEMEE